MTVGHLIGRFWGTCCGLVVGIAVTSCTPRSTELAPEVPTWDVEEVLRKDGASDPAVPLNRVTALTESQSGHVFLTQWQSQSVLVLDAAGSFVRQIGRAGTGPGEFVAPTSLGWRGDTLWVADPMGSSVELFSESGEPLGTVQFVIQPSESGGQTALPTAVLGDGTLVAGPAGISMGAVLSGRLVEQTFLRASRDAVVLDTLVSLPIPRNDFWMIRDAAGGSSGAHPIRATPLFSLDESGMGLIVVERDVPADGEVQDYVITHVGLNGDTGWSQHHAYVPAAVAGDFLEQWMERSNPGRTTTRDPALESLLRRLTEQLELPRYHAPVTALVVGRDGTIWLRREEARATDIDWEVFDGSGAPVGRLTLPIGLRILHADRSHFWGETLDSLGVSSIVKYRVTERP